MVKFDIGPLGTIAAGQVIFAGSGFIILAAAFAIITLPIATLRDRE